jgi:hypothetical protein
MSEYMGMLGAVTEACDIHRETGCSVAESFEVQTHLAALRDQEYRDAIEAAERVIYYDFRLRTRLEK